MRDRSFGAFFGEPFAILGENAAAVLIYVVVLGGLNATGIILGLVPETGNVAGFNFGFLIDAGQGLVSAAFEIGAAIIGVFASYFLLAQLLASRGRLRSTDTRIWAYVGISILSVIGFVLGFFLLVVPGFILLVRWSASSGFLIGQRLGIVDSLGASWDATRGYSWPIFFAGLVIAIILSIVFGIIGGMLALVGSFWLVAIVTALGDIVSNAVFLAFGIGVFCILTDDSAETAEVFE